VEADLASEREQRLYLLLGILNSAVTDWCFRIENSNNHVGNYELDNLPFPQDATWFDHISSLAFQIENAKHTGKSLEADWRMDLMEATVGLAYGLDPELELRSILEEIGGCNVDRTINYALHLKRGCRLSPISIGEVFYNHSVASLSDLDRQIISHVPEGGNWQNIPMSVPSKRLEQIREMTMERGGVVRTTYYGRLRRDQPAYTINTYFNRPGNGTHIHPVLDRTLTSREAARLQSFPDSYLFSGTEGAIRNQIGNAIPPLLAAAIGKKFIPYMRSGLCVDVFCGAGGLSLGLESVGWHVLSAIDNDQHALNTYCLNRPSRFEPHDPDKSLTSVYRRDLHEGKAFEDLCGKIEKALQGRTLDLLVGGPPCQGFSHAGFRLANDKRNDLASSYLHFAKRFKPRIFILENVEGLLTFKNGTVLRDLGDTLREIGYRVCEPVWRLSAEQYGVPQMRRRIFLVATNDDSIDLSVPRPTHERCAGRRADPASQSLFESTLMPPHTVEEALAGLSFPNSKVNEKLSKRLSS
jgi:DNA (cytosine-5)-methyltransferase 1